MKTPAARLFQTAGLLFCAPRYGSKHNRPLVAGLVAARQRSYIAVPTNCSRTGASAMEKWPIGVFASLDAGLGVKLEVARDLGVPTIQLHAPHKGTRTKENADAFLKRLKEYGIRLTAVFCGF